MTGREPAGAAPARLPMSGRADSTGSPMDDAAHSAGRPMDDAATSTRSPMDDAAHSAGRPMSDTAYSTHSPMSGKATSTGSPMDDAATSTRRLMRLAAELATRHDLPDEALHTLIAERNEETRQYLRDEAAAQCRQQYGNQIFLRGLIEFTNICKNDCCYCGIRRSNQRAHRYRLTPEQILDCCSQGYEAGYRTFVLQGGEDPFFTDERMCAIVAAIRKDFPGCAITLSIGERSRESYRRLYEAGADRYLLRHETADSEHYQTLHPADMSFSNRMHCLEVLKDIGYQVGCGFMVGSPGQTVDCLVKELRFIKTFRPHMVGIGPFLAHRDTPFGAEPDGSVELTLYLLSLIRLLLPGVLLPATTALGTAREDGREEGILHGANVIMPNLSPREVRKKYELYDNKLCSGAEAAEGRMELQQKVERIGYRIVSDRGDSRIPFPKGRRHITDNRFEKRNKTN